MTNQTLFPRKHLNKHVCRQVLWRNMQPKKCYACCNQVMIHFKCVCVFLITINLQIVDARVASPMKLQVSCSDAAFGGRNPHWVARSVLHRKQAQMHPEDCASTFTMQYAQSVRSKRRWSFSEKTWASTHWGMYGSL